MASRWLLLLALLVACNRAAPASSAGDGAGSSPADLHVIGTVDLAAADLAVEPEVDLAVAADLARSPDQSVAGCKADKDCRLQSNMCAAVRPNPCVCIPRRADEPNPPCGGPMVLCDTDPCEGKTAACDLMTGKCIAR